MRTIFLVVVVVVVVGRLRHNSSRRFRPILLSAFYPPPPFPPPPPLNPPSLHTRPSCLPVCLPMCLSVSLCVCLPPLVAAFLHRTCEHSLHSLPNTQSIRKPTNATKAANDQLSQLHLPSLPLPLLPLLLRPFGASVAHSVARSFRFSVVRSTVGLIFRTVSGLSVIRIFRSFGFWSSGFSALRFFSHSFFLFFRSFGLSVIRIFWSFSFRMTDYSGLSVDEISVIQLAFVFSFFRSLRRTEQLTPKERLIHGIQITIDLLSSVADAAVVSHSLSASSASSSYSVFFILCWTMSVFNSRFSLALWPMSPSLPLYLFMCVSLCMSLCWSFCLLLCLCLSLSFPHCLFLCLSLCQPLSLNVAISQNSTMHAPLEAVIRAKDIQSDRQTYLQTDRQRCNYHWSNRDDCLGRFLGS